jgi:prevent-host-death family protein
MATTVNMHEAKTQLSKLIERAANGEEVVIARAGKPIVRLTPVEPPPPPRSRIGFLKGQITVPDNFDTMFQSEIEEMFYGKPDKFDR